MIKYLLKCNNKHEFESWFSDSKEFEKSIENSTSYFIIPTKKQIKDYMNENNRT